MYLDDDLTFDDSVDDPGRAKFTRTEAYRETAGTADLKLEYAGVTLVSEFGVRRVVYDVPPRADYFAALINGVPAGTEAYDASFVGYAYYLLGAYQLPLGDDTLGGTRITPYAGFDEVVPDTTQSLHATRQYRVGLNVKPSPYVTLKVEGLQLDFGAHELGKARTVFGQMAVAF